MNRFHKGPSCRRCQPASVPEPHRFGERSVGWLSAPRAPQPVLRTAHRPQVTLQQPCLTLVFQNCLMNTAPPPNQTTIGEAASSGHPMPAIAHAAACVSCGQPRGQEGGWPQQRAALPRTASEPGTQTPGPFKFSVPFSC